MDPDVRKKGINALLGIWSIDTHTTHIVTTQFDKYDVHFTGKVTTRDAPGGMHDLIYTQLSVKNTCMRPIVHQILDRELTLLSEIALKIELLGIPMRCIKQCRVDSLLVQPGKREVKQLLE